MSPRHVLVVGAGGFCGSRIVARLPADGHRVTCAGRDPAALRRHFPGTQRSGRSSAPTTPRPGRITSTASMPW